MRFLAFTCSKQYLDELQGDLLEIYYRDLEREGSKVARRRIVLKVLLSPRWYRIPRFNQLQPGPMHISHFKVAWRHAGKHPSATFIQILGLVLGLSSAFFIGLFSWNELAHDRMHEHADDLYRVLRFDPVTGERGQATSSVHGALLQEEFPFLSVCRYGNDPVKMGEVRPLLVEDFYWADSTFFEMFSFRFVEGDPKTCLDEVNSVVITSELSRRLFAAESAVGKTLPVKVYDGNQEFLMKVTGVVEPPSGHTHIQFQALGSMHNAESLYNSLLDQWGFSWLRTYIQVPESRLAEVEAGIPALLKRHLGENVPPGVGGFNGNTYLRSVEFYNEEADA
ncbi:MAG: ABC transporter permease, partial [Pseudomonadota bacterium]